LRVISVRYAEDDCRKLTELASDCRAAESSAEPAPPD
jgi:hypothetical protein